MVGLIDCNNFFASCERVFNPGLNGKPVVVLSNNDGCVIARSNESKALGIKMGVPFYQIKELARKENVAVFSSNYSLYGDMSSRVMALLTEQVPSIDVYSIDEAFLDLDGISGLQKFGKKLVRKTYKSSGIPVSLGIAPTRTLAKLANHFAKKYPAYNRVCIIDNEEKRIKALQLTPIEDVWGIGRRHTKTLHYHGIQTAYDFTQKSRSWVRHLMTVIGERTWLELQGISCIATAEDKEKKQICTSRSFGETVSDFHSLRESVANFASLGAQKLRKQQSLALGIIVFAYTNRHRTDLAQYFPSYYIRLSFPTADTSEIVKHAQLALARIYREGYQYKKTGVILTDIIASEYHMEDLFDPLDREKQRNIAKTIDTIVKKNGTNAIKLASLGNNKGVWKLKREFLSKCPSTNIKDIIEIHI